MSILEVNGKSYTPPELLAYWIREREIIHVLKESGEKKPWSDDPVFRRVYFCNVCREDDKVTKFIRQMYTVSTFGVHIELAMVAARIFNFPPTLGKIPNYLAPYKRNTLACFLEEEQKAGHQIWGGAYLITTHGKKMSKIDYCTELLAEANEILPYYQDGQTWVEGSPTCLDYHIRIMDIAGMGSFLAAQVVADLKHTEGHVLQNASDWYTFSAPGPGSLRGLAWYYERDKVTPKEYQELIKGVALYLVDKHGSKPWNMQDLQNCLCEFDKYCRVLTGSGRSKRKYPGA